MTHSRRIGLPIAPGDLDITMYHRLTIAGNGDNDNT
jgi:hypothetical protein